MNQLGKLEYFLVHRELSFQFIQQSEGIGILSGPTQPPRFGKALQFLLFCLVLLYRLSKRGNLLVVRELLFQLA